MGGDALSLGWALACWTAGRRHNACGLVRLLVASLMLLGELRLCGPAWSWRSNPGGAHENPDVHGFQACWLGICKGGLHGLSLV